MHPKVEFEKHSNYVHATVTGTNSREAVIEYMDEVLDKCKSMDCFRVLIEERLEGPRLETMDVFTLVSEGSVKALGRFEAIAFVDEKMGEMAEFAETVAVNRGMPFAAFDNIPDAKNWLSHQQPGPDEQYIFWDRDES